MSIRVSHLSYTYRARTTSALVDINAEFRPGEVTLIAGASGCGKTTLLRCINGLIPNSYANGQLAGTVSLFGQDNADMLLAQISQVVGTVLQDPEQQIIASQVMNEIAFGLENLALPREQIRERIHKVARFLHIEDLLGRETFRLSGGEKQKVALAGVLAMRPKALLLDEPLASLDPASGYETLQMLRELADSGIAIVIIEHRVEDVLHIQPEHCVYMSAGSITYDGDAAGLVQAVDWREIKLPARLVMQRLRQEQPTSQTPAIPPAQPYIPADAPALIEFQNVSFQYSDGPEVLHDISFRVRRGDRIALLGPNGAGKTTLVKHAIGLNKPTRGQVLIEGRDSKSLSVAQIARGVGFVFQSPSHMLFAPTVREELAFGPRNIGMDQAAIARNVTQALSAVNLPGLEDLPPLSMSFGQQKRVSIASILTMNPRVLVLDEPSAGQDYANYTHIMNDMVGVGNTGENTPASQEYEAVVFITHDLDIAIAYANRVLLMAEGQVVADGAPQDVLQDRALLERCRVRSTSLLEENLALLPRTRRFLPAAQLAAYEAYP